MRSGAEVLVKKVFHLPSPCAIFYQLRLIALFVNVMNLYNNGLIMTMIMLIMMSLIIAGIASGKTFFVKHFQSHFLQCLQCHFQLQCIQRHFLWCAKLFEVFPLYHQKSLPTPCKMVITNLPNIPELKGPQYCNIAMYLFLAAQAAPYIYVWVNGSCLRNLNQGGYNYILAA